MIMAIYHDLSINKSLVNRSSIYVFALKPHDMEIMALVHILPLKELPLIGLLAF
jgi:hypothetical protein